MTEKRYILSHNGKELGILDKTNDKGYYGFELARLVNELSKENEELKEEIDYFERKKYEYHNKWNLAHLDNINLRKENEQLKEALKELKEIGDYQEMRIQELCDMNSLIEDEIDKKIAVLTDAKIKSFQDGDEELLGKIKFSIQV